MTAATAVLSLVPLAQSTTLLAQNIKLAKKKDKDVGDFAKVGVQNIVGIELIKLQGDIIGSL